VVDALDHDRRSVRGDPPRKSLPHGDAYTLLDLLLEALGGSRDEVA
jgi:hypothetical protein